MEMTCSLLDNISLFMFAFPSAVSHGYLPFVVTFSCKNKV